MNAGIMTNRRIVSAFGSQASAGNGADVVATTPRIVRGAWGPGRAGGPTRFRGYGVTVNFFLLTIVPLTPTTVIGPVVAPAGTVAVIVVSFTTANVAATVPPALREQDLRGVAERRCR